MKYIVAKAFNKGGISGMFNLPVGTEVIESGGLLHFGSKKICWVTGADAKDYFARNDDGKGEERFAMTQAIKAKIQAKKNDYAAKVNAIASNMLLPPWEREERISEIVDESALAFERIHGNAIADACLTDERWNTGFYNAPIQTLELIMSLVEGQEGVPQA